jgi:hypothetical protein
VGEADPSPVLCIAGQGRLRHCCRQQP